jgi:hypothetical protein
VSAGPTRLKLSPIFWSKRLHLARGHHAFGLGADIDQDLVLVDPHNRAIHRVAVLEVPVIVGGVEEELLHQRTIFSLFGRLTVRRVVCVV